MMASEFLPAKYGRVHTDDPLYSFRYQLAVGSVLWVVGVFTMSVSKTYVQLFLSYSVCLGVRSFPPFLGLLS